MHKSNFDRNNKEHALIRFSFLECFQTYTMLRSTHFLAKINFRDGRPKHIVLVLCAHFCDVVNSKPDPNMWRVYVQLQNGPLFREKESNIPCDESRTSIPQPDNLPIKILINICNAAATAKRINKRCRERKRTFLYFWQRFN